MPTVANTTPQKALQAELLFQTSPSSRKKNSQSVRRAGRSMLAPSGRGNYLLGFVFWLHQPLHVHFTQDEGPVEDGHRGVHGHDADDQRVYHGG